MKGKSIRFVWLACATLVSAFGFSQTPTMEGAAYERASARAIASNSSLEYSPYTIIVRFENDRSTFQKLVAMVQTDGVFVRSLVKDLDIELWGTMNPARTLAYLQKQSDVKYAELDYVVHSDVLPNDPSFGSLYGLHNSGQSGGVADADIDAPEAWDIFTGGANFVIADIDTGVDYSHPDLAANCWINPNETVNGLDDDGNGFIDDTRGWDFVNSDNNPMDDNNHGTHTSGTFGAVGNNGVGVTGINWQCKIMALKFLNASGSGSTSSAISCLNYAKQKGVKVSNNSWGGGGFSQALYDAINSSKSVGHLFIAAAGNSNVNTDASPHYPSSYNLDNIISVASTDRYDLRSSFSNYGATSVDIGAPGSSILSTTPNSTYSTFSGTSMACPHVAGVAALVYALNPSWTYQQVRQRIFSTARPISALSGITVTGAVANAAAAIASTSNTPPTVTITSPANNSSFAQGSSVTFTGSATDAQDGGLTASLAWTSSLQGSIGTGGSFSRSDLVAGTHVITASVTDSGGLPGSTGVSVTITTTGIPAAPSGLAVIRLSDNIARVTWIDNSSNETNFDVQRQIRVGNTWSNTTDLWVGANVTLMDDPAGDGRFRYRVRSRNASGSSAFTGWITVRL